MAYRHGGQSQHKHSLSKEGMNGGGCSPIILGHLGEGKGIEAKQVLQ